MTTTFICIQTFLLQYWSIPCLGCVNETYEVLDVLHWKQLRFICSAPCKKSTPFFIVVNIWHHQHLLSQISIILYTHTHTHHKNTNITWNGLSLCLDFSVCAIVEERLVWDAVTYDLWSPSLNLRLALLIRSHNDRAAGRERGVLVEKVEGTQEESHWISWSRCVGNVFRMRNV